jgi:hypothetical protein
MGLGPIDPRFGAGGYHKVEKKDKDPSDPTGQGNLTQPAVLPPGFGDGDMNSYLGAMMIKLGNSLYQTASQQEQSLRLQAYAATMASAQQDFKAHDDMMNGATAELACSVCSCVISEVSSGVALGDTLASAGKQTDSLNVSKDASKTADVKAAELQQNAIDIKILDAKANYASEFGKGFSTLFKATGDFMGAQGKADADVDHGVGKVFDANAQADLSLANQREEFKKKMAENNKQLADMMKEWGDANWKAMQSTIG